LTYRGRKQRTEGSEGGFPLFWRQRREQTRRRASKPGRHPADTVPDVASPEVTTVSAEEFVARVPGQTDGHVCPRHPGNEERRDLGRVGERFVVQRGQLGNGGHRFGGRDIELGMIGAQVLRDRTRMIRLVVAALVETDGERT